MDCMIKNSLREILGVERNKKKNQILIKKLKKKKKIRISLLKYV